MGERLLAGLATLRDTGIVGDVRGIGLLAAVELVQDPATGAPFDRDRASPGRSFGKQPTGACSCGPARSAT